MASLGNAVVLAAVLAGVGCADHDAAQSTANAELSGTESAEPDLLTLQKYVGLASPNQSVCRIELLENQSARQVLTGSRGTGGATCYDDGRRSLYFPNAGDCSNPLGDGRTQAVLTAREAASEMTQCMAVARNSDPDATTSIVMTASMPDRTESVDAFTQFSIDLSGLASHGALPVTHLGTANGIICLETDRPERVVEDIETAEIVDGQLVNYEIRDESCATASVALTNLQWPTRF